MSIPKEEVIKMIVMNHDGDLFDERRKKADRRKKISDVLTDRRKEDRRKVDINAPKRKK